MNKSASIAKYELKMQIRRIGGWLVFAFSMVLALLDNFPSAANIKRLAELPKQDYVVYRLIGQPGIILLFGLMFLLSNRIRGDWKSGTLDLFTTAPIRKAQYLGGKILGNSGYLLCMTGIYLAVNGVIHAGTVYGDSVLCRIYYDYITCLLLYRYVLIGNPRAFRHPTVLRRIRHLFYGKSYHRSGKGSKRLAVLVPVDRGLKKICLSF